MKISAVIGLVLELERLQTPPECSACGEGKVALPAGHRVAVRSLVGLLLPRGFRKGLTLTQRGGDGLGHPAQRVGGALRGAAWVGDQRSEAPHAACPGARPAHVCEARKV